MLPDLPAVPADRVPDCVVRPRSAAHNARGAVLPRLRWRELLRGRALQSGVMPLRLGAGSAAWPVLSFMRTLRGGCIGWPVRPRRVRAVSSEGNDRSRCALVHHRGRLPGRSDDQFLRAGLRRPREHQVLAGYRRRSQTIRERELLGLPSHRHWCVPGLCPELRERAMPALAPREVKLTSSASSGGRGGSRARTLTPAPPSTGTQPPAQ
jgi:hypothetical protein